MPVNYYGSLPFAEALAFFRAKLNLPTQHWDDLLGAAHDRAFVVAGAMHADLLADLRAAVDRAIADGTTFESFRKDFERIVAERGWTGWTGENTKGGQAWRARTIYDTNLFTSYSAGRHRQMKEVADRRPYWRYRHSPASVVPRPEHLAWDGVILRHDDPWWSTHYPPCGWNSLVPWEGVQGKVMLGLKARYSGPIVEITGDSGRRLCLTGYHPVLTDRGWMPAGQVREGCNLLRYRFELDRTAEPANADNHYPPPRADQVFETLAANGLCSVPGAAFDLYGDMRFAEGDVEVVGANRELLGWVQAEALQFRKQFNLMLAHKQNAVSARSSGSFLASLEDFWRSFSGAGADGFHPLAETCFTFTPHHHGAFVEFNPRLFQMRRQGFSADMEAGLQFAQRGSGQIHGDKVCGDGLSWPARLFPGSVTQLGRKLLALISGRDSPQAKVAAHRCRSDAKPSGNLFDGLPGSIGLRRVRDGGFGQNLNMPGTVGGRRPFSSGHFDGDYFTAGPYRNARVYESPSDVGGTNPKAHRDIMQAHPGLIELDRVKEVRIREFAGHVYDFQTKNGLILSFGGFCVSNCKCYVETLAERDLKKQGLKITPNADIPYNRTVTKVNPATGEEYTVPEGVDRGWDYAPGAATESLADLLSNKKTAWGPVLTGAVTEYIQRQIADPLRTALLDALGAR